MQYSEEYILSDETLSGVRRDIAGKLLLSPLVEVLTSKNPELAKELHRVVRYRDENIGDTHG
jgi:hypothetical protein